MIYNRENIPVPRKGGIAVSRNESADRLLSVMRPREDLPRMPGFMAAVFLLLSALAAAADLIRSAGPDSLPGRTAAVMIGASETTFYVAAVYLTAAGVRDSRWAIPAALCADLTCYLSAAWICRRLWG